MIYRIEVSDKNEVLFYFTETGTQPKRVVDFHAGTGRHELLSAMESRIREFNAKYGT